MRAIFVSIVIFLILGIVPLSLWTFYRTIDASITAQVLSQQQTVATITATAVKIKLDRLVGIAEAMASSTKLSSLAVQGKWDDAVNVTRDLQNSTQFYDTYIDRVVIFDKSGVEQSAYPALVSGIGSSATSSAWYRATMEGAPFFVSNVTQRAANPHINVINVAAPINVHGSLVGTLVMQIPAADFLEFGQGASLGAYGFLYIVDSKGNVIIHPKLPQNNGVVNLSSSPVMERISGGDHGVLFFMDAEGALSVASYQLVSGGYNWVVVAQEPYTETFSARDKILWFIIWEIIAALLVDLFIALLVFFFMTSKNKKVKAENRN